MECSFYVLFFLQDLVRLGYVRLGKKNGKFFKKNGTFFLRSFFRDLVRLGYVRLGLFDKKNAKRTFRSFIKNRKNGTFFYKERKRSERMFRSF